MYRQVNKRFGYLLMVRIIKKSSSNSTLSPPKKRGKKRFREKRDLKNKKEIYRKKVMG
jgi:hypothetical protein